MFSRTGLLAFSLATFVFISNRVNATELHVWSKAFGGTGSDVVTDLDWSRGVGNGGIFAGSFVDTIAFGGPPLVSAGGRDGYLVGLNHHGDHVFSFRMGGTGDDIPYAVWASSGTGYIVVGSFTGTANFGGDDLVSAGGTDIFIARYGTDRSHILSERFGGTFDDACVDVSHGPLIVTGFFGGTINLGGDDLTSAGGSDIFVARFDGLLGHVWSHRYGGPLDDIPAALEASGSKAVVVGSFAGTANLGGVDLTSAGGSDAFYAQYTLDGVHERSAGFGGASDDFASAVAFFVSQFWVTGAFQGSANFGGGALTSYGGRDAFVAAFNTAGVHLWSKRLGGPFDDEGTAIDVYGMLAVTGTFAGTANLGGGLRTSAGGTDIFLSKFEPLDGFHRSSQAFGGELDEAGAKITVRSGFIPEDYSRSPILAGAFRGSVNFGGETLTSAGETDVFLLDLADTHTGIDDAPGMRSITVSCFPNPFNPRTAVIYTVPIGGPVTVAVFDAQGAHVATLVNSEHRPAGEHRVEWDGRSKENEQAASGVYFVKVDQLDVSSSTKLVLLK